MPLMRPLPAIAMATVVASLVAVTTPAAAQTTCTYDPATFTVSLASEDLLVGLAAPGGVITYTFVSLDQTTPPTESPCGEATTSNTDAIRVSGAGEQGLLVLLIDVSRGPFAPGMTAEPTGVSEIEIAFESSARGGAIVQGTEAPEVVRFGTLGANINADDDPDVTIGGLAEAFGFLGLGGDDDLAATGGLATGEAATLGFVGDGGEGADLLTAGLGRAELEGGAGDDILTGGPVADDFSGGAGNDRLVGGAGKDELEGDSGDDRLLGGPSKDHLVGGRGRDRCIGGPGKDTLETCNP
jgi:hypothetical protein